MTLLGTLALGGWCSDSDVRRNLRLVGRELLNQKEHLRIWSGPPSGVAPAIRRSQVIMRKYDMANTKSAKKAARQAVRRTEVNKARTSRARTAVRSVEDAIKAGDKDGAAKALREAAPLLARNAQKGVLHKKTASRKISRLNARVKAISK